MNPAELEYLCLEELPNNCFVVIRVDVPGPMEKNIAAKVVAQTLSQYRNILLEKRATVMVMTPKEGMDILTEEEMNAAGWVRKEK